MGNAHTIAANFTPSYIPPHKDHRGDIIRLDGGPMSAGIIRLARTFAVGASRTKGREKSMRIYGAGMSSRQPYRPGRKNERYLQRDPQRLKERGFQTKSGAPGTFPRLRAVRRGISLHRPYEHRTFEPGMVSTSRCLLQDQKPDLQHRGYVSS